MSENIALPDTRDGHRAFNEACATRARMVHYHPTREPGKRLKFEATGTDYKVAPDRSLRKISEPTAQEKRAEKKARWKSARNQQQKTQ